MKKADKYVSKLRSLIGTNTLIEVDRSPVTKDYLRGFVVGVNARYLALCIVDEFYFLNGFTIVRIDDVKRHRVMEVKGDMIRYVLSQRYPGSYLRKPTFDLGDMQDFSFLERIQEGYPLITVFREEIDNSVCSIGRLEALKPKTFLLHTIDIDATWDNVQRFRYEDVTRVDFGGLYEEALWMYAEYLSTKKKRQK